MKKERGIKKVEKTIKEMNDEFLKNHRPIFIDSGKQKGIGGAECLGLE